MKRWTEKHRYGVLAALVGFAAGMLFATAFGSVQSKTTFEFITALVGAMIPMLGAFWIIDWQRQADTADVATAIRSTVAAFEIGADAMLKQLASVTLGSPLAQIRDACESADYELEKATALLNRLKPLTRLHHHAERELALELNDAAHEMRNALIGCAKPYAHDATHAEGAVVRLRSACELTRNKARALRVRLDVIVGN